MIRNLSFPDHVFRMLSVNKCKILDVRDKPQKTDPKVSEPEGTHHCARVMVTRCGLHRRKRDGDDELEF